MLLRTPDFYKKFHCIADKCTDTCCVGWEIDVDEKTFAKYRATKGEFGDRLRASICDGHFCLLPGDRCPFLDKCGLCEIYKDLGKDALCDICREHPRFVEVYGEIKEQGVGLCCEEGVRLLLEKPSTEKRAAPVLQFVESEVDDVPDELPDDVREARNQIFHERENMFKILEQREIPLNMRLQALLKYATQVSGIEVPMNNDEICQQKSAVKTANSTADSTANIAKIQQAWIEILGNGESLGPAWDKAYKAICEKSQDTSTFTERDSRKSIFNNDDGAKIVAYMLFRYYAKSLFDGDSLGKVQFAIFFWIVLQKFGQELATSSNSGTPGIDPRITAVKLLSKQVEYSEEVMDTLAEAFTDDEAFSIEAFFKMLE